MSRRAFLRAAAHTFAGLFVSAPLAWLYSTRVEPDWLDVERVTLALRGLPRPFEGFTLAQFSDLHLGPFARRDEARSAVDHVNSLQADAIVFTGDFVSQLNRGEAEIIAEEFARLRAPGGVFAILGNHDHWADPAQVAAAARASGLALLLNSGQALERGGGRLWLAGVDDVWEARHDLNAALAPAPSGAPVILLAHEPDYADTVAADGRVALQLSGHSHGGQVRLPLLGAPVLPWLGRKYPSGLRRLGDMWLYTNRGVGMIAPPVRLNCRPEITLFTLVSA